MAESEPLLLNDIETTMSEPSVVDGHETPSSTEPKATTNWWRRIVGLIWDSVEGDARNRRYVQKLDTFLL
jgi:hypothetical protein